MGTNSSFSTSWFQVTATPVTPATLPPWPGCPKKWLKEEKKLVRGTRQHIRAEFTKHKAHSETVFSKFSPYTTRFEFVGTHFSNILAKCN